MKSKNLYIIAFAVFIIVVTYIGYGITIQCKESSVFGNFVSCAKDPGGR
jgi:type VI protein secretion system component VasF